MVRIIARRPAVNRDSYFAYERGDLEDEVLDLIDDFEVEGDVDQVLDTIQVVESDLEIHQASTIPEASWMVLRKFIVARGIDIE